MFLSKSFFSKLTVPVILLLAACFFACSGSDSSGTGSADDEQINLDYSTHKLEEKLTWITNNRERLIASPNAKKGGTFYHYIKSFPLTFRTVGPDSNNFTRGYFLDNQLSLISINGDTERIIPELATHWAYGKDGRTMYFKLNPDAKWSDGQPVTADDYIFTLEYMRSKHIQAPWYNDYYTQEVEKVTKYGDYLISVSAVKKIPDLWLTVNIQPTPKHYYGKIMNDFIEKYNWAVVPNTGPYILKTFEKGKYLLFERKKDWWGENLRYFKNRFNVDYFKLIIIRDENVAFEYFKKGELDTFGATRAEVWYDRANGEIFDRGYVNRLWFYNDTRMPTLGLFLNLDRDIFKDKNLRYALAYAINFDKVNKQLFHNEATRLRSFFTGYGTYTNPSIGLRDFNIPKVEYYMKASGWYRGPDGIWSKKGNRYSVTISYKNEYNTPRLVIMKEEAKKAGIELNLELLDASNAYKKVMEKKHEVSYMGWSTSFRPQPWEHFHSVNAHKPQTNNVNNLDDPEMDKLIDRYRESTDEKELISLSRRIQQKIYDSGCWIPLESIPFVRFFLWRWIRYPEVPGYKTSSEIFDDPQAGGYFWIDEDIKKETLESMKTGRSYKPVIDMITRYK